MQLVSFEMPKAWRRQIDKRVDAGEFDSFSAYMRALVRRDLGVTPRAQPGNELKKNGAKKIPQSPLIDQ